MGCGWVAVGQKIGDSCGSRKVKGPLRSYQRPFRSALPQAHPKASRSPSATLLGRDRGSKEKERAGANVEGPDPKSPQPRNSAVSIRRWTVADLEAS